MTRRLVWYPRGEAKEQLAAKTTATAKGSTGTPSCRARSTAMGVNSTAVVFVEMMFDSPATRRKNSDRITAGDAPAVARTSPAAR